MEKREVIFDAERMRYPNTGLYHYSLQLGNALLDIAREDEETSITIYSDKNSRSFRHSPKYFDYKSLHKFFLPIFSSKSIWHCNFQLSNYIPSSRRVKKVITVHDLNFLREKSEDKYRKYLKKMQRNIDRADVIVCISEFVKQELLAYCNLQGKRVEVIYNGNNINSNKSGVAIVREGLDLSKPFLFSIGVLLPKKNFLPLVHLLVNNDLNLVISGHLSDRYYQKEIMELAKKLGVQDRVFLTGPISEEEKCYLLEHCHVFCFPSITEGFGLPVVEAMHFGCNIILSSHTSLPEIGGDVVRYFDSFEPKYLEKLGTDVVDWELNAEQREQVKERSKLFTWENAAKAYWKLYQSL